MVGDGITQLLIKWGTGDRSAFDELMPLLYDELRRLANSYLRQKNQHQTLQPTALVHEAYLRLVDRQTVSWQNRAQFLGLAAKVMRGVLVDESRAHLAAKRGGSQYRVSLVEADRFNNDSDVDLLALDEALRNLAALDSNYGQVVELRYFGGLTIAETAEVLGISDTTVERDWRFARAWLKRELSS